MCCQVLPSPGYNLSSDFTIDKLIEETGSQQGYTPDIQEALLFIPSSSPMTDPSGSTFRWVRPIRRVRRHGNTNDLQPLTKTIRNVCVISKPLNQTRHENARQTSCLCKGPACSICLLEVSHLNTSCSRPTLSLCLLVKTADITPTSNEAGFKHCVFPARQRYFIAIVSDKICSSCLSAKG